MSKQRVEHHIETIVGPREETERALSRLEREGWELCGVDSDSRRFIFKRPFDAAPQEPKP